MMIIKHVGIFSGIIPWLKSIFMETLILTIPLGRWIVFVVFMTFVLWLILFAINMPN